MIIISKKLRGKFRERAPEWVTSFGILWWGLIVFTIPGLFEASNFYYPLSLIMNQFFWGITASVVGFGSIASLLINGVWRPTAHLRAIFSILKITIWASLLLAALSTDGRILGVPTFSMLLSLDIMALWWAAGDARLADDIAAKKKKITNGT
jgi:hypothetical protein